MHNKITYTLFLAILVFCCSSCHKSGNNCNAVSKQSNPIVEFTVDSLSFQNISNKSISISIQNEIVMSFNRCQYDSISVSLLDIVRKCKDKNETALQALKNDNALKIRVFIENEIDTTYNYYLSPYYDEDLMFSISGQCAPLISKFSNPTQTIDIKKWLFRKKEHLDNEKIHLLCGLINQLSKTKTIEYVTNSTIPIIHSFSGLKYKVNSSLVADYYVLYACSSSNEIDKFVEYVISNDFNWCVKTLNNWMECRRQTGSNGYKCICLIAINNDWTYKIQPLGLIAIDNLAPVTKLSSYEGDISSIKFSNDVKVLFPHDKPQINGLCDVSITNSVGDGIECNVSFRILFAGDVKSVTVKRTKKLCYDSWHHKVENKVINLTDKLSPYTFTYMLHLTDGDNYIPIIVEDNHGNKREFEINERAEFVRNDAPSINIDNNINVDNY